MNGLLRKWLIFKSSATVLKWKEIKKPIILFENINTQLIVFVELKELKIILIAQFLQPDDVLMSAMQDIRIRKLESAGRKIKNS